jgi:hypothetical protein
MLLQLMGCADVITAINLLLLQWGLYDWHIGIFFLAYLLFKGIYFFGDVASFLDILIACYMLLLFTGFTSVITYGVMAYLCQKAYFSFI